MNNECVYFLGGGSDTSGVEAARQLGVKRNQLYKWQKELQEKGDSAFKGPEWNKSGQIRLFLNILL